MMASVLEGISSRCFDVLVLLPIRTAHRLIGDEVWDRLEPVTASLSRTVGKVMGPFMKTTGHHQLSRAMAFIDTVEAIVGVHGTWEVVDDATVVRKVPACPFGRKLSSSPSFCTRLGSIMGKEALRSAFPEQGIEFEIHSTISQGHPCCTYKLRATSTGS